MAEPIPLRRRDGSVAAIVTRAQNQQNKEPKSLGASGYRGVVWYASKQRWVARLMVDGKWKTRGGFRTAEEAAVAAEELRRIWHPYAA